MALNLAARVMEAARRAVASRRGAPAVPLAGLEAARTYLLAKVREALAVPYSPGTRTPPGAPPRRRTGRLMDSIRVEANPGGSLTVWIRARANPSLRHPGGFPYGAYHELARLGGGRHPFAVPTANRHRADLARMAGRPVRVYIGWLRR